MQVITMSESEKEYCDKCKTEETHLSDIDCLAYENESISWGELAQLTHTTQLERFGWCICEDPEQGQLAEDCPKREGA